MACLKPPAVTIPTLPPGFSTPDISASVPGLNLAWCCKIAVFPPLAIGLPPIPINPAIITAANAAIATLQAYYDALGVDCPLA